MRTLLNKNDKTTNQLWWISSRMDLKFKTVVEWIVFELFRWLSFHVRFLWAIKTGIGGCELYQFDSLVDVGRWWKSHWLQSNQSIWNQMKWDGNVTANLLEIESTVGFESTSNINFLTKQKQLNESINTWKEPALFPDASRCTFNNIFIIRIWRIQVNAANKSDPSVKIYDPLTGVDVALKLDLPFANGRVDDFNEMGRLNSIGPIKLNDINENWRKIALIETHRRGSRRCRWLSSSRSGWWRPEWPGGIPAGSSGRNPWNPTSAPAPWIVFTLIY